MKKRNKNIVKRHCNRWKMTFIMNYLMKICNRCNYGRPARSQSCSSTYFKIQETFVFKVF